jgi:hypothetical protein
LRAIRPRGPFGQAPKPGDLRGLVGRQFGEAPNPGDLRQRQFGQAPNPGDPPAEYESTTNQAAAPRRRQPLVAFPLRSPLNFSQLNLMRVRGTKSTPVLAGLAVEHFNVHCPARNPEKNECFIR